MIPDGEKGYHVDEEEDTNIRDQLFWNHLKDS